MRLQDKVAVITGAGSGIGCAIAQLFAKEGAQTVIVDVNRAKGEETVSMLNCTPGRAVFLEADISIEEDAKRISDAAVCQFGGIDILVNNAVAFVLKGLDASVEEWNRALSVNVIGTALCSRFVAERMKTRGGGAIINLGSIAAFTAQPQFLTYAATKAAIVQMTRSMAMDLAPFHIRVNCVCPGTILTPVSYDYAARTGMTIEQWMEKRGSTCLLKRVGQPGEVASAVLFLASEEASFITGACLMVDGGFTAQ